MTREEFDIITNKIGCWFTHLKLNSFRKTFDGEVYPSSALGTDYDLFIHKLEKELLFEDNHSLPSNLDEAAEEYLLEGAIPSFNEGFPGERVVASFKAGAEWMAGQGQTIESLVWRDEDDKLFIEAFVNENEFKMADNIIIQIRKKQ